MLYVWWVCRCPFRSPFKIVTMYFIGGYTDLFPLCLGRHFSHPRVIQERDGTGVALSRCAPGGGVEHFDKARCASVWVTGRRVVWCCLTCSDLRTSVRSVVRVEDYMNILALRQVC